MSCQNDHSSVEIMDYLFPPMDITDIGPHRSLCRNSSSSVAIRQSHRGNESLLTFPRRQSTYLSTWICLTSDISVAAFCNSAIISWSARPNWSCHSWMSLVVTTCVCSQSSLHWSITYIRSTMLAVASRPCFSEITVPN